MSNAVENYLKFQKHKSYVDNRISEVECTILNHVLRNKPIPEYCGILLREYNIYRNCLKRRWKPQYWKRKQRSRLLR